MSTQNSPWVCPRCGRMNAPFNPVCFCSPEEEKTDRKSSERIMDVSKYLKTIPGSKIADNPYGYKRLINERCLICNGIHMNGVSCVTLEIT